MSESAPPPPPASWPHSAQNRLVALAMSCAAGLFLAAVAFGALYALTEFVAAFSTVIWPLAVAGILSLLLRPIVRFFEIKLKFGRITAIAIMYVLVTGVCLTLTALVLPFLLEQLLELAHALPDFAKRIYHEANDLVHKPGGFFSGLQGYFDDKNNQTDFNAYAATALHALTSNTQAMLTNALSTLRTVFQMAASVAVVPIYLYFLLESQRDFVADLRQQLTFLRGPLRHDLIFLVEEFVGILVSFFRGQLLIGLCMGVMKAFGLFVIGVEFGPVLGLIFGLLNVVPYLGTILGLATILPIAYFQQDGGGLSLVGEAIAVFIVVQMIEGYFLTPKIMGSQTGLHPMVIIVSIFFWGEALHGLLGMVLAVPLTAFLVVVWRLLRSKYLPKHGTGLTRPPIPTRYSRPAPPL
jgi:predicted PurR-regulated permease PerM